MANAVDLKAVVKHIVDGTLAEKLCRICLMPFGNVCENMFTKICKEDTEFCIADVLKYVCNIEFTEADNYSVCVKCFIIASSAYKFYLLSQRSTTILNYYVGELEANVSQIDTPIYNSNDCLCITLPVLQLDLQNFDFDIKGCTKEYFVEKEDPMPLKCEDFIVLIKKEQPNKLIVSRMVDVKKDADKYNKKKTIVKNEMECSKIRRKRDPMTIKQCSLCPVKYRFVSKLQEHMKQQHNVDLFVCKICKALIENEQEFNNHLKTHTNVHRCALCNALFKRRETIIAHLKWHYDMKHLSQLEGAHVCEKCGVFLLNEDELKEHNEKKHNKQFTCFYCGRSYRGETSFEMHIKKHELHSRGDGKMESGKEAESQLKENEETSKPQHAKKRWICDSCGRNFVDERALTWHTMLHTNDRPYICETCGRGFVSVNRRNQHSVCAHTVPTKRCPLCPALFHLRSMVNTHIKKVHLKAHKRRNRTSKHQNVFWRTEPVPIQELSVSIQNEILELKTRDHDKHNDLDDIGIDWSPDNSDMQK